MASEASSTPNHGSDDPPAVELPVEQLPVNLKVISPNMTKQLIFELPAVTTVAELKDTIRQSLAPRFAESPQRLIYRGRMLNRSDEKLLDIFGEDMVRSSEQQSIHLVLPELPEKSSLSSSTTPVRGQSPAPVPRGQDAVNNAHQYFDSVLQQGARHMTRRMPTASTTTTHLPITAQPAAGNPSVTQPVHPYDNHHQPPHTTHHAAPQMFRGTPMPPQFTSQGFQQMAQRLNWEAARHRAYMNQWDRGAGGTRYNNAAQPSSANHPEAAHRRSSPAPHAHEGQTGQDNHPGQRSRVIPGGAEAPLSDAEVQTILRGADARQAIVTMTSAMQRSASGASLGPQSGRATPSQASRTVSSSTAAPTTGNSASQPGASEVYILYSPTGPRGLLINNHSETYYTPQVRPAPTQGLFSVPHASPIHRDTQAQVGLQSQAVPPPDQHHEQNQNGLDPAQNRLRRRGRDAAQAPQRAAAVRRANPGAAAVVARVWPHFWLAVKLGLFVWWFASPGSTWSRWFILISMAITIFVLNVGALDSIAEHVWRAICRHMENLIPMAGPNAQGPQRQNVPQNPDQNQNENQNQNDPDAGQRNTEPGDAVPRHPAGMAARLIEDRHQANANWLMDQVRRMERASLLFLASIMPGVAERHIARIEAEMERLRREAEAAEAEATAAEEARSREAEGEAGGEDQGAGANGEAGEGAAARESPVAQDHTAGPARDPPPLAEAIPL